MNDFLHKHGTNTWFLDHRLTPEVRAMLVAMTSRMPVGGIKQRYDELVNAVVSDLWEQQYLACIKHTGVTTWAAAIDADEVVLFDGDEDTEDDPPTYLGEFARHTSCTLLDAAQQRLCEYPLHPKVQEFFDRFVGQYGHGSILEATGSPTVYADGLSWYAAYLLFDGPLVVGQENSTRAVTKKGWPMCREATMAPYMDFTDQQKVGTDLMLRRLRALHDDWMEVFEAEKLAWEGFFEDPEVRASYGLRDVEPFRPALDRARWALPGTISTGVAFASHVRERARALDTAKAVAGPAKEAWDVFDELEGAYRQAVPGIGALGLKEAVYGAGGGVPRHLQHRVIGHYAWDTRVAVFPNRYDGPEYDGELGDSNFRPNWPERRDQKSYADPLYNHWFRVDAQIFCSLAVARDWHRHRTFYPWRMDLVRGESNTFWFPRYYRPMSDIGKCQVRQLFARSSELYDQFVEAGDTYRAMLCLPLGTAVRMSGSAGLRDALYTFELRANAHGANFEYEEQARAALWQITQALHRLGGDQLLKALKYEREVKT